MTRECPGDRILQRLTLSESVRAFIAERGAVLTIADRIYLVG